ncbi:MAG: hypothetical protein WBM42_17785, partial [Eudoraea sp.]|uniref:hypothetical protein n=1 Tax=Eudoraea sp. TaxID=1979955 RepID=UPI003C76545A
MGFPDSHRDDSHRDEAQQFLYDVVPDVRKPYTIDLIGIMLFYFDKTPNFSPIKICHWRDYPCSNWNFDRSLHKQS